MVAASVRLPRAPRPSDSALIVGWPLSALLCGAVTTGATPAGSTLTRVDEPVVIQQSLPDSTGYATGSINVQLPGRLLGIAPGDLVAFRWDGAGSRFRSRSTSARSWT